MERLSDTITSLFHIHIKDNRPVVCSSEDGAIVWSDILGLGWRFGVSYNPREWFAKVRLHLDHNHSESQQDQAIVSVALQNSPGKDAKGFKERITTISYFGHGEPALLGSWSPSDLASFPYVALTLSTKTRIPQPVTDPLSAATTALRQSMESGDFVDTKFYVFSAKRTGTTAGKPRVVYANSSSIKLALPKATSSAKQVNGSAPPFLVNMTGDHHINGDSVLHEYEYEQDSDLDDEDEDDADADIILQHNSLPGEFQAGSSAKPHTSSPARGSIRTGIVDELPPAYSVSTCRMILVKGLAYKTWASYIYFRYTGQVSFLPLKSARSSSAGPPQGSSKPPCCSPKSMYRLAESLGDERLMEFAFRAIKQGLSKDNIVDEAFSWFTAQHPAITEFEVDKVFELRQVPEVASALKLQLKAVSLGEKPWAQGVLIAIMEKLNPSVT